jgi:hypothetical protein
MVMVVGGLNIRLWVYSVAQLKIGKNVAEDKLDEERSILQQDVYNL